MEKRKELREKSSEFIKFLVEKAQTKEEPAQPNFGDEKDMEKIKQITQELKDQHAAKKGIRTTKGN